MILDTILKTKKRVQDEYNKNCEKINELERNIQIIKINTFGNKMINVFTFSMIPWVLISIAIIPITVKGVIPFQVVQPISVGVPLLIGIGVEYLFDKKCKSKELLKKITSAKTSKEKIEEILKYQIEIDKLKKLK